MSVATLETRVTRKPLGLKFEIVTVTPEMAAAWLTKNVKNRKISHKHKAQYVRDMKSGNWRITGDAIRFDNKSNLIDGQHRLQACIDAGVNFTTAVIYGLQSDDQDVIDTMRPRTAADALAMHNHHGTILLASMCRLIASMKADVNLAQIKLSTTETLRIVRDRPKMGESVGLVWGMPPGIPRPALAVVHYAVANVLKKKEAADAFVAVFKGGVPHYPGCAAHALRERLIRKGDSRNRIAQSENLRAYIHAWNLFSRSESIASFKVPKEAHIIGVKNEKL